MVLDSAQPAGCSVSIDLASNNGDVTVAPTLLAFTDTTWNTAQPVTARAGVDADAVDETVAVTHTAATATASEYTGGVASLNVTVADAWAAATDGRSCHGCGQSVHGVAGDAAGGRRGDGDDHQ